MHTRMSPASRSGASSSSSDAVTLVASRKHQMSTKKCEKCPDGSPTGTRRHVWTRAMASDELWTTVTRKGGRAIGARAEAKLAAVAAATNLGDDVREDESALSAEALATRVRACATRIERAVSDVREATFVDAAVEAVRAAVEARRGGRRVTTLVLGLGSPAASAAARCQLAFATILVERLRGDIDEDDATTTSDRVVTLKSYDPCFTVVDEKVLAETYACETLTREACDEYVSASTSEKDELVVFYMPHCEGHLYESVVRARWSAEALADFICVGNTFETYADRWRAKNADPEKKRPSHVIAASSIVNANLVDPGDTFVVQGAFNDTSIQTFDVKRDDELPEVVTE